MVTPDRLMIIMRAQAIIGGKVVIIKNLQIANASPSPSLGRLGERERDFGETMADTATNNECRRVFHLHHHQR